MRPYIGLKAVLKRVRGSWITKKREVLVVLIGILAWGLLSLLFAWLSWDEEACQRPFVGEDGFGRLVLCRFLPASH